jgi:uncharacterized protein YjbJ (UPF0337 family)
MNTHQIQGRFKSITGQVEELMGKASGNKTLEAKGLLRKIVGNLQTVLGDATAELRKHTHTGGVG